MLMQLKQVCNHPVQYLHDGTQVNEADMADWASRSGKLERLVEMLEEIIAEGDHALIFTQFAEMGEMLSKYLPQALESPVLYLHGGTPAKARDGMIQRFQEEPKRSAYFYPFVKGRRHRPKPDAR